MPRNFETDPSLRPVKMALSNLTVGEPARGIPSVALVETASRRPTVSNIVEIERARSTEERGGEACCQVIYKVQVGD